MRQMTRLKKHIPGQDLRPAWGRFAPDGETYRVLETDTPRPWTNLISNWTYGAFFTQHGMGFSFFEKPKICEVTRWSLNESRPSHFDAGRLLWIRDADSAAFWPGNPQPGERELYTNYRCDVGLGWSEISAERDGVECKFRFFVPLTGNLELWTVTLTNLGGAARNLVVSPVVEFATRGTYIRSAGAWSRALKAVRAYQPGDKGWRRMDAHVFMGLDRSVSGWDVSRSEFRGFRDDPRRPKAIETGLTNSAAENEYMVGALETHVRLEPGAKLSFNVILGYAVKDVEAAAMLKAYRKPGAVEAAFKALQSDWSAKLDRARCTIPEADVGRFLSIWGKYAVTRTSQLTRSQQIGYRDQFQDLRGLLIADPPKVREWILKMFAYISRDGTGIRAIDPVGTQHNLADLRDNPLWGVELVVAYVKETGDFDVLKAKVPWFDGGTGSLWDHLVQVVMRLVPLRGRHGITLVAEGDWNDALGEFGIEGRGESAWLQLLVIRNLRLMSELAAAYGRKADVQKFGNARAALAEAFNKSAWDGNWYVYGWDDDGVPIGSHRSPEGRIHANVQTWALMEGVVPQDRVERVWKSLDQYLWTDAGLVTAWPPYIKTQPKGSYIKKLGAGTYENASVYCHGTTFYIAACAACGRGDEALRAMAATLPTNPRNPKCDMEPYATTNFFVGPSSKNFGRVFHSWFTGSAAWLLFQGWESVLGIQPEFDGLKLAPCVPRSWTEWTVRREFRGACYEIVFRKPRGSRGRTVTKLVLDGNVIAGNTLPVCAEGVHKVEVLLG